MEVKKIRTNTLKEKKQAGEKIAALTPYDFPTAKLVDEAGVDVILVGDSVANVVLGYETTLPVSMEEMLHHTKAVSRGVQRALVVADMPFMSYQTDPGEAIWNAGRFLKEAGAHAVKVEGGGLVLDTISEMVNVGIQVMGHIGFTPQSVHQFGTQIIQAKTEEQAAELIECAKELEEVGVFALVLECIPAQVSRMVTEQLGIPTIGIGAGPHCDGQILVFHDLVGLSQGYHLRFVKQYATLSDTIRDAVGHYVRDVRENSFPTPDHSLFMSQDELQKLMRAMRG